MLWEAIFKDICPADLTFHSSLSLDKGSNFPSGPDTDSGSCTGESTPCCYTFSVAGTCTGSVVIVFDENV